MNKVGYCVTCNNSYPLEVRVAGKVIALGLTTVLGTSKTKLSWWATLLIGLGSLVLAHKIDEGMALRCPSPGCTTILKIVETVLS